MTGKKTEKMCKEIDEEGYYRWIEQRDEKRFRWINILKKGKIINSYAPTVIGSRE